MTILLGSKIILHHLHNPTDLNLRIKECKCIDFATVLEKRAKACNGGGMRQSVLRSKKRMEQSMERRESHIFFGGKINGYEWICKILIVFLKMLKNLLASVFIRHLKYQSKGKLQRVQEGNDQKAKFVQSSSSNHFCFFRLFLRMSLFQLFHMWKCRKHPVQHGMATYKSELDRIKWHLQKIYRQLQFVICVT